MNTKCVQVKKFTMQKWEKTKSRSDKKKASNSKKTTAKTAAEATKMSKILLKINFYLCSFGISLMEKHSYRERKREKERTQFRTQSGNVNSVKNARSFRCKLMLLLASSIECHIFSLSMCVCDSRRITTCDMYIYVVPSAQIFDSI